MGTYGQDKIVAITPFGLNKAHLDRALAHRQPWGNPDQVSVVDCDSGARFPVVAEHDGVTIG